MRTRTRTGVALAVAGLATSGFMFATIGSAGASTPKIARPHKSCQYVVKADTLNVRKRPTTRAPIIGHLYKGQEIKASCWTHKGKVYFWRKLRKEKGVPEKIVGGWVAAKFLSDKRSECKYKVKAHHLKVRFYPTIHARVIGKLHKGQRIKASCHPYKGAVRHWVQIRKNGVKRDLVGGWVDRKFLKRIKHHRHHHPHGWVRTGAGGSAERMNDNAAAGGAGAVALAGGLAFAGRRRPESA
jgi:uncharacterized protein YgiM (DUF1202 family)